MAIYSHCPICGMPLDNYDDVGARKHIDRCTKQRDQRVMTTQRGPRGRPKLHEQIKSPGRSK